MSNNRLLIKNTRDLGLLFRKNDVNMIGQDGAYSIPLDKDSSMWLFGDTFVGSFDETGKRIIDSMPNNTGLISRGRDIREGINDYTYITDSKGNLRQLIPLKDGEKPGEFHIWGMDAFKMEDDIYWYYILVRILPDGQWPFKFDIAGSGLAKSDLNKNRFHRVFHSEAEEKYSSQHVCYGVAVHHDENDNFLYVYGTRIKEHRHQCRLSRVRLSDVEDIAKYEYLSSPTPEWHSDPEQAICLMEGMPTEMSVSYNACLEKYLAVHSWETSGRIVGRTAPHPWGPWSEPSVLWTSNVALRNPLVYQGPVIYAGKEHPEYARKNGRIIYVTCVEFEEYFPRLIEIEFDDLNR